MEDWERMASVGRDWQKVSKTEKDWSNLKKKIEVGKDLQSGWPGSSTDIEDEGWVPGNAGAVTSIR